jgi:uroporphyrin-III C-methyltransferase/precorrin-2 dehydrogenase/sirohydrochlorin ferrochelatase
MVFGRAGEEIDRLTAEGIPATVVPGITSASAMAASLRQSMTHRGCAQSVRFITGHGRDGELPAHLDFRGLADPATTLVVYMGGRTASAIATRLMEHGAADDTPVVAMARVTRADEQTHRTTLSEVAAAGLPEGLPTPVLLGIGRAFTLQQAAADAPVTKARAG